MTYSGPPTKTPRAASGAGGQAVAARSFTAIITDGPGVPLGYPSSLGRYYRLCPSRCCPACRAACSAPVAGASVRPEFGWLPRGGGPSCNEAVGLLDGTVKEVRR